MSENEKLLLDRAKRGDIESFEALIEKYQKKVFNIALRMLGNHDDASELAQEAFIKIYKSIEKFKEESSFSTWVYRIATNVCLDEIRKRKNKKVFYIDEELKSEDGEYKREIVDNKPTPAAIVERKEIRAAVNEAINKLSDEHRTVIIMRDIHGMSYEEISRIVQCPEGTIKSRISRARLSLKEILKGSWELFSEKYVK